MATETLILRHLLNDEIYARRTLPYLKPEYFASRVEKTVYEQIDNFINKYNSLPTKEALVIELDTKNNLSDSEFAECGELVSSLSVEQAEDSDWLIATTEKFCQEKAVYNAIMESINILDEDGTGKDVRDKGAIPDLLSTALSVSFDPNIGHDFVEDADERFDFYHRKEERVPFDLEYMNKITGGGLPRKSLNILMAGTGAGKSLAMCHMGAANLMDGKNVLYITMEMAEEKIAERIDANLLNVTLDNLKSLSKDMYKKKIERVKGKTAGKLIIKEYPTASGGVGHFRHLLNEMKLKKSFIPDIIYIDYLNICSSSRMKAGSNVNSYTLIKAIAEELRGLAVEQNVPIVSATQVTRSGYGSSDIELTDTSESFGLPATADFMAALIVTEELDEMNQIMIKQLKNRYGDPSTNKRFMVGIDRAKMRLYDVEQTAQEDVTDTGPTFDKTGFGSRAKEDDQMKWATKTQGRKNFSGFNM
ncbi:AAA family ATPase [Pseudomonadales bacterium]|nr:AAA family ATPase [bacterium]MDB4435820.1 AAA family ATPase [bacterium]MDB4567977.1 AAA family ATPase [Pseudomonadales bacterium]